MAVDMKYLKKSSMFGSLDAEQAEALACLLQYRHVPAGQMVCTEGEPGDSMFFIEKGEVAFFTLDARGHEKEFRRLRDGDFFGEVALLTDGRRTSSARATTEAFALELRRADFDAFLRAYPELAMTMLKEMAHRLGTSGKILRDTVTPSTIEKEIERDRTPFERFVEELVHRIGTVGFLAINLAAFVAWIVASRLHDPPWDAGLGFLALFVSIEALTMTVLVLAKQNRDELDANIRTDRILEHTDTTEDEIRHLRERLDRLTERILHDRQPRIDPPRDS